MEINLSPGGNNALSLCRSGFKHGETVAWKWFIAGKIFRDVVAVLCLLEAWRAREIGHYGLIIMTLHIVLNCLPCSELL